MSSVRAFLTALPLLVACGCGSHIPVSGTVTYPDGTPLEVGTVAFQSATHVAKGEIKPGGKYTIGSLKPNDGVPEGEYKVYITGAQSVRPGFVRNPEVDDFGLVPVIDEKFASPQTTPLVCNVTKKTVFNIVVDPYSKP